MLLILGIKSIVAQGRNYNIFLFVLFATALICGVELRHPPYRVRSSNGKRRTEYFNFRLFLSIDG